MPLLSCLFGVPQVDRCVTGLIAQQQTVGPLQITLADVAVIAQVSRTDVALLKRNKSEAANAKRHKEE